MRMAETTLVLLAAGRATRMRGADKMLEPVPTAFGDRPLLEVMARRCLRAGPTRVVIGPGQPARAALLEGLDVTAADLHLMMALGTKAPDAILRAAGEDGRPGHPVLFPADLLPELAALTGDTGARSVLARHGPRVHLVPLSGARALTDLDTPEAWAAWRDGLT
jgi:CTP:molybdopterin cytidylyltransferase MocA